MAQASKSKTTRQAPATNRPVKEFRSSNIRAVLWLNSSDSGDWYSITISRSYKTSGGEWKETNQFNRDDLLIVSKLSELAYHFIDGLKHEVAA